MNYLFIFIQGTPHSQKRGVKRSVSQTSTEMPPLEEIQFLQVPETIQEPKALGSIEISLSYDRAEEKLITTVLSAHELSPGPSGGPPNPYVRIVLQRSGEGELEANKLFVHLFTRILFMFMFQIFCWQGRCNINS